MDHWHVSLVINRMIYIPRFKEELARAVNHRFIRQDVGHLTSSDEANAGAYMIVLADIAARIERQLRDPQLVFIIKLSQEPSEYTLEFDFGHQPSRVHFDRFLPHCIGNREQGDKQCEEVTLHGCLLSGK